MHYLQTVSNEFMNRAGEHPRPTRGHKFNVDLNTLLDIINEIIKLKLMAVAWRVRFSADIFDGNVRRKKP